MDLIGIGALLSGVAAILAAVFSRRASTRAEDTKRLVTPNGTGHATLVGMVEDVLVSQGRIEEKLDSHDLRLRVVEEHCPLMR